MSLTASPTDVIIEIIAYLSPHDLTQLIRTCKCINEFAWPCLWKNIELHYSGYHESSSEFDCPSPFVPPSKRPYLGPGLRDQYENRRSTILFELLDKIKSSDKERFIEITSQVKSLCTVVD